MNKLTIKQINKKATELMGAFKSLKIELDKQYKAMTDEEKVIHLCYSEDTVSKEQQEMINFFRSFDEEALFSDYKNPSAFYNPRGFTMEYRDLAFGRA